MGVYSGVCPTDGLDLVKEWLHVFSLSHYMAHTDKSLEGLDDAIHTVWQMLKDPARPWSKPRLPLDTSQTGDSEPPVIPHAAYGPPKLHFMSHYGKTFERKESSQRVAQIEPNPGTNH
jgi:hypothetical protein